MSHHVNDVSAVRARLRASSEALAVASALELSALSEEEALRQTLSLELFTPERPPSSESSGLVEQQAVFHRVRRA